MLFVSSMPNRLCTWLIAFGVFSTFTPILASEAEIGEEIYRAKKNIVVNTDCKKVWEVISDFSGIAKWYSGFTQSKRVGGSQGQVGEVRELLRSSNGQVVRERLIYLNSNEMELAYTHTFNGPVKESIAIVSMSNLAGGQCLVSWSNTMKLKEGQEPSNTVEKFNSAYKRVLEDLRDYLTKIGI